MLAVAGLAVGAVAGTVDSPVHLLCLGSMALLSSLAILLGDRNDGSVRLRHLTRLLLLTPFELVLYRPVLVWAHARGVVGFFRGERHWAKFERNPRTLPTAES